MAQASTHWNVGDVILDLYKVTDILGEGGFGKVYKVYHQSWNVDLAVKSPKPEIVAAAGGVESFESEAETWVNLGLHPHTVSCYYVRRIENSPLVFAEYVAGGSLADWIEERRLYEGGAEVALKRILDIAIQFAWGLHYAHEQGLIHQDVKPANVMMTSQGVVKVTDFGLAKGRMNAPVVEDGMEGTHTLVTEGSGAMTPAYCSPEQASGESLTRRTDLWSWAVSVLEMFQGERTWSSGIVAAEALEFYLEMGQDDLQLPQMPELVAQLLRRCFRENPSERHRTILDAANELKGIYQQEIGETYPRTEPDAVKEIADSLNNRAVSLLDLGKQDEALQLWEQALQRQPQHCESLYNKNLVLWRVEQINDASLLAVIKQLQLSNPGRGFDNLLGLVQLERGNWETAITLLERIKGEEAQKEEIMAGLALARERFASSRPLMRTFEGHRDVLTAACLSSDCCFALSGSADKTLKLWDIATGICLRTFEGHVEVISLVSLSSDCRFALSQSADQIVKLWDVETGNCLRTCEFPTEKILSVSWTSDSRCLALTLEDRHFSLGKENFKLWDVATGNCLQTFGGKGYKRRYEDGLKGVDIFLNSNNSIYTVKITCLSADGRFVLSGSNYYSDVDSQDEDEHIFIKPLKLWDVATGNCLQEFEHNSDVSSVCLSADGRFALSLSSEYFADEETVKLWDVATGKCLRTFEGHTKRVTSVFFSADGRFALSGSEDNTVKLWDVSTGCCLQIFDKNESNGDFLSFSVDGHFGLSRSADNSLKLWQFRDLRISSYSAPLRLSEILTTDIALIYEQELQQAKLALSQGNYIAATHHLRTARTLPRYNRQAEAVQLWTSLYIHLPIRAFVNGWEITAFKRPLARNIKVCLSANSHIVLSGGSAQDLNCWHIADLERHYLKSLYGLIETLTALCLSADGRLAMGSGYKYDRYTLERWGYKKHDIHPWGAETIMLWDVTTGGWFIQTFHGHTDTVVAVCLSTDNHFALSGSLDKTLKLWDVATGHCLRTFEGHTREVTSVCLSSDSRFALSGSADKTLKLWNVTTGRCLQAFEGHINEVTSVCLNTNRCLALSGSLDKTLKLWDVATGHCLRTFEGHTNGVTSVCLSSDSRFALSGSRDSTLKLWNVTTGSCLHTLVGHQAGVTSVCLSTDKRFALSGSEDETVRLWTLDWELDERVPAHWDEGARSYLELFLTQQTPYAYILPAICPVSLIALLKEHTDQVTSVCLSADGCLALSGSDDKTLKLWDLMTGSCLRTFEGHTDQVTSVALSGDSLLALSGSWDNTLKLWDVATGNCIRTFEGHKHWINSVCLSGDSRLALSGSGDWDKTVKVWDVATGNCLRTFEGHKQGVKSVCLSADGHLALSGSSGYFRRPTVKLWNVDTGECLQTFEDMIGRETVVVLNADGRFAVLTYGNYEDFKLWDIATKNCLRTFEGHTREVTLVCLSADGRFALSSSADDTTLKLWDVATGNCLRTLKGHSNLHGLGRVKSVCLSNDGRLALSGSDDNTLRLWATSWDTIPSEDREPTEEEINLSLTRSGTPTWTEQDFQNLLYTLGCAGYGWLRPEGVRQQLEAMAAIEPKPSPLVGNALSSAHVPSEIAQTPQVPSSPDKTVALTEQFPESSSVESEAPEPPPELPTLHTEPVAEQIQPASLPTPGEIESTPERRRQVSPFTRTNRVAVVTFFASYTFLAILMQSIWSLGWLGSLLLPVIPAFLLAWYLANLATQRTK